jgi:predicted SAM-dependent methyltransferase
MSASSATVLRPWTIVPVMLKPDALIASVAGSAAADFAMYLAQGLDHLKIAESSPRHPSSKIGAIQARDYLIRQMLESAWFTLHLFDVEESQRALLELESKWAEAESVDVPDLIRQTACALGFTAVAIVERAMTLGDYYAVYGDSDEPEMHPAMQAYLVGMPVRMYLYCGLQNSSALQVMKAYIRWVLRYPGVESPPPIQNWIHVNDPDASNLIGLLSRFFGHGLREGQNSKSEESQCM